MVKLDFKNPMVSIALGLIVSFIVFFIVQLIYSEIDSFIAFILGGFIATYFAKERRIIYGLYEGVLFVFIITFIGIIKNYEYFGSHSFLINLPGIILLGVIFGTIGGFIGKKIPKKEAIITSKHI